MRLLVAIVTATLSLPLTAAAEDLVVLGAPGANGSDGMNGTGGALPTAGAPGEPGESLSDVVDAAGEDNTIRLIGGTGGQGGGGGASESPGIDGAPGGAGGDGGAATAESRVIGSRSATAHARGGAPGSGGNGGSPGLGATRGASGPYGARAGDGVARARVESDLSDPGVANGIQVTAEGFGGDRPFFTEGGRAGDGNAVAEGIVTGVGLGGSISSVRAFAVGGMSGNGGVAGDAFAEASGSTDADHLNVTADADGGRWSGGGSTELGQRGKAEAIATGVHTGTGTLSVVAEATAGLGTAFSGPSALPGTVAVEASGVATNGADVGVRVRTVSTGPQEIRDAVSGSTAGQLTLVQEVWGSTSGRPDLAGDAVTSLTALNPGGGDLTARVTALGGDSGRGLAPAPAGLARVDFVTAEGSQAVTVRAEAVAGEGSSSNPIIPGGQAEIGSLFGRSTGGGPVLVEAIARGVDGGGDVILDRVVDGETTGVLELRQEATSIGDARATSQLETLQSSEHIEIESLATGGYSNARGHATNEGGSVEVLVQASSGIAISDGPADATAESTGISRGDGHEVRVGALRTTNATGGFAVAPDRGGRATHGGHATSESTGIAEGDSRVTIYDYALGGNGGAATAGSFDGIHGGDASSRAVGSNRGVSDVRVDAQATGGNGGSGSGLGNQSGRGGNAVASVRGESTAGADVFLDVRALGGVGGAAVASDAIASGRGGDASVSEVSGATSGLLRADVQISGGSGGGDSSSGSFRRVNGGDALVDLDVENEGGGALVLDVEAGVSQDGRLVLDRLIGRSNAGADVTVVGDFSGAQIIADGGTPSPNTVVDFVDGETTGVLSLEQNLSGGGSTGLVRSRLTKTGNGEGLSVSTFAGSSNETGAEARAEAENSAGWADSEASALAYAGSDASAEAVAGSLGTEAATSRSTSRVNSASSGGSGSASGGRAISRAEASALTGEARARADVNVSGEGTDAVGHALARNQGSAPVNALVVASTTGEGAGGTDLSARGESTGGADVDASVSLNRRETTPEPTTALHDAVSGSTTGLLSLRQDVQTTRGDAETSLVAENEGGGDLSIRVGATALPPNPFGFPPPPETHATRNVRLGPIRGHASNDANVSVSASARGEAISLEDVPDGRTIWGESRGGDVDVTLNLTFIGADESTSTDTTLQGGAGRSALIENAVDGDTSGHLTLRQWSVAGDGESVTPTFGTPPNLVGGNGGEAVDRLVRSGDLERLEIEARSTGGDGGAGGSQGGVGGSATSQIEAVNVGGSAQASGHAAGGRGGLADQRPGDGGRARVDVLVRTEGDGHAIALRSPDESPSPSFGAFGGEGVIARYSYGNPTPVAAGNGGEAVSESKGVALGDSEVAVTDYARGGRGGGIGSIFSSTPGIGGSGGDAYSTAEATNAGLSRVSARAHAVGGTAGVLANGVGNGGTASASSSTQGLGVVLSIAEATGGTVFNPRDFDGGGGGAGHARAFASGTLGQAVAIAHHTRDTDELLSARVEREIRGEALVEAFASVNGHGRVPAPQSDGFASWIGQPTAAEQRIALEANHELAAYVDQTEGATIAALGQWGASSSSMEESRQHVALDITLQRGDLQDDLRIAVFNTSAVETTFESLTFGIEVNGESYGEQQIFDDVDQARTFFQSLILLEGALAEGSLQPGDAPAVRVLFDVVLAQHQAIELGIAAVVVPEPSSALFLGMGLFALASGRKRRN